MTSKNVADSPTLASVGIAIDTILGENRLEQIPPDECLLRSGVITSIELVTVVVGLEKHFGVSIQQSDFTVDSLTLYRFYELVGGKPDEVTRAGSGVSPNGGQVNRIKFPVAVFFSAMIAFLILDFCVEIAMESVLSDSYSAFLENGERLYPFSGSFSHDDFNFAIKHHRINTNAGNATTSILFFGDSGTIGSYLPAALSIPAFTERNLSDVQIHNLAWYGRLLPKDLMILELAWDHDFDIVVFTLGADYFNRENVNAWIDAYPHVSFNWQSFDAFSRRIPDAQKEPFDRSLSKLHTADTRHFGPFWRTAYRFLALTHYRPFLQYNIMFNILPDRFISDMKYELLFKRDERVFATSIPTTLRPGLWRQDIDQDQLDLLEQTIVLLSERGTKTVLFIEPAGPSDWPHAYGDNRIPIEQVLLSLAERTGALVIDMSWAIESVEFMDSNAHYTAKANERLGVEIANTIRPLIGTP